MGQRLAERIDGRAQSRMAPLVGRDLLRCGRLVVALAVGAAPPTRRRHSRTSAAPSVDPLRVGRRRVARRPAALRALALDADRPRRATRTSRDAVADRRRRPAWARPEPDDRGRGSAADVAHQTALLGGFTQLGVPYRRNTSKPGVGFDCSGLTTYAWGVAGVALTRQSGAQIRAAAARDARTRRMAGDLVYYPGHVTIWLGVDQAILHAPTAGPPVEVDYVGKRRIAALRRPHRLRPGTSGATASAVDRAVGCRAATGARGRCAGR